MTKAVVPGSTSDIATQNHRSIAETFLSADVIVLVDTSASMGSNDSRNGMSRYDVACDELANLQKSLPGRIAVLSFSDSVVFCPDGVPVNLYSGTRLAEALQFAKVADIPDAMRFFIISDGMPDSEKAALKIASQYKNRIDVIYVGPEDQPTGRDFLTKLAHLSGGQAVTANTAQDLAKQAQYLLNAG